MVEVRFERLEEGFAVGRPLIDKARRGEKLTEIELAAAAYFLQTFYTDIEAVFKAIAQHIDGEVPDSDSWHKDLLDLVASETNIRQPVISKDLASKLEECLAFRHFSRNATVVVLQWDKMASLALECESILRDLQTQVRAFLKS